MSISRLLIKIIQNIDLPPSETELKAFMCSEVAAIEKNKSFFACDRVEERKTYNDEMQSRVKTETETELSVSAFVAQRQRLNGVACSLRNALTLIWRNHSQMSFSFSQFIPLLVFSMKKSKTKSECQGVTSSLVHSVRLFFASFFFIVCLVCHIPLRELNSAMCV